MRRTRSRKGCFECRKRKIKCDEGRPSCGQCRQTSRSCSILSSLFRADARSFHNPRPDHPSSPLASTETEPVPVPEPEPSIVWTQVPEQVVFTDPALPRPQVGSSAQQTNPPTPPPQPNPLPGCLSPGSAQTPSARPLTQDGPFLQGPVSNGTESESPARTAFARTPQQSQHIYSHNSLPVPASSPHDAHNAYVASPLGAAYSPIQDNATESSPIATSLVNDRYGPPIREADEERDEVAFFLRQYSEGLAKGMDIFGQGHYFSRRVLVAAKTNALVRYSACALAAKRMGQTAGHPAPRAAPTAGARLVMAAVRRSRRDYLWYGAKYYERAIQMLAGEISRHGTAAAADFSASLSELYMPVGASPATSSHSHGSGAPRGDNSVLVAACLLIQYERLSATIRAWAGHVGGVVRLLKLNQPTAWAHGSAMGLDAQSEMCTVQPLFWYVAANDFESSFIDGTATQIDSNNLDLWRAMGLPLDDLGHVVQTETTSPGTIVDFCQDREGFAFYELIRLICNLINTSASPTGRQEATPGSSTYLHDQGFRERRWTALQQQFDDWHRLLPLSFQPDTVLPHEESAVDHRSTAGSSIFAEEVWFSNTTCAVATAHYHMARILLLIMQPQSLLSLLGSGGGGGGAGSGGGGGGDQGSAHPFDLLRAYRVVQDELRRHAGRVVAIALGMAGGDDACGMMHMVQPLYVSGRCLTEGPERRRLVGMLRAISRDLGVATEYRIADLCSEWEIAVAEALGWEE